MRRGDRVANAFDDRYRVVGGDGRAVEPVCKGVERPAVFSQPPSKPAAVRLCKLPDGVDAVAREFARGRRPDKEQVADGQWPDDIFVVLPRDDRRCVGLFYVRAEFGKNFVVAVSMPK